MSLGDVVQRCLWHNECLRDGDEHESDFADGGMVGVGDVQDDDDTSDEGDFADGATIGWW